MIVKFLMDMLLDLFCKLIPESETTVVSDTFTNAFNYIISAVEYGQSIFYFFVPKSVFNGLLTAFLVLLSVKYIYLLVMFILRKIPSLNIH